MRTSAGLRRRLALLGMASLLSRSPAAVALDPSKAISQYVQDAWTTDQGLPHNAVRAIAQTRDGYLWVATDEGLARFDGVRFAPVGASAAPGVTNGPVSALLVDKDGALWIGTRRHGLGRLEKGELRTYAGSDGLADGWIRALSEGAPGTLWIGMGSGGGLTRLKGGRFKRLTAKDGLSSDSVLSLHRDSHGRLWIGTDKGLDLLESEESNRFIHYSAVDGLGAGCVLAICEDRSGALWIGTKEGDANSLVNPGTLTAFKDGQFTRIEAPVGMSSIVADRQGTLWVGTLGGGLRRLQDRVLVGSVETDVLSRTVVHALLEDREGSLWIGTDPNGLRRLKDGAFSTVAREEGLFGEVVETLYEDRSGVVWLGTRGDGVFRLKDGAFTRFGAQDGLSSQRVSAICEGSGGALWIGTGAGLVRFEDGRLKTFSPGAGAASSVSALWPDPDGGLWVGTWGGGLFRFAGGRFTRLSAKDGLAGDYVTAIRRTRDGTLWIGTTGGTSRLAGGKLTNASLEGLPVAVQALCEDQEGYLWIGTKGAGLFRFKDGKLAHIGRKEGLFDDDIGTVGEDGEGNFWMSGSRGVFRTSRRELQDVASGRASSLGCISYGTADGMRTRECAFGQGQLRTRDGRVWFATIRGASIVNPAAMPVNTVAPQVVIEGAVLGDRPLPLATVPRIQASRDALTLHYAGLSLLVPERVRYRYRLDRYDSDWVDAGSRREASYSGLSPGDYTFRVAAANNDGVWSRNEARLAFVVLPRFWQTSWFRALAALSVVGLAWLGYRRRISKLEEAKETQERFSRRLIELQEQERKRIASELHDSLGQSLVIIKNRAVQAQASVRDPEGTLEQLVEISESATEALAEVRQIAYDLRPFLVDRLGITKAIEALIRGVGEASGLKITSRLENVDACLPPAGVIGFYRIVQEGLGNVVKHAEATEAEVAVRCDQEAVHLVIRDNGKGFVPGASRDEPGKGGFGLVGMAERAKILGADLDVRSQPGQGTTIDLRVRRTTNGK